MNSRSRSATIKQSTKLKIFCYLNCDQTCVTYIYRQHIHELRILLYFICIVTVAFTMHIYTSFLFCFSSSLFYYLNFIIPQICVCACFAFFLLSLSISLSLLVFLIFSLLNFRERLAVFVIAVLRYVYIRFCFILHTLYWNSLT